MLWLLPSPPTQLENVLLTAGDSLDGVKLVDFGSAVHLAAPSAQAYTYIGSVQYMAPEVVAAHSNSTNVSGGLDSPLPASDRASQRRHGYSFPADMWSLGVLLYVMLCRQMPFAPAAMEHSTVGSTSEGGDGSGASGRSAGAAIAEAATPSTPPQARGKERRRKASSRREDPGMAEEVTKLRIQWGQISEPPPAVARSLSPQVRELLGALLHPDARKRPTAAAAMQHAWFG